jgi:hypothetical protein
LRAEGSLAFVKPHVQFHDPVNFEMNLAI